MDYQYIDKDSFLGIKFNYTPNQVKAILGEPDSVERYYYPNTNEEEYDETYYYQSQKLRIIFSYENSVVSDLSIYTKCFFINEKDIFSLSKSKVLNVITSISSMNSKDAYKETVKISNVDADEYDYKDIGLALWFEGDALDEICLYNPR